MRYIVSCIARHLGIRGVAQVCCQLPCLQQPEVLADSLVNTRHVCWLLAKSIHSTIGEGASFCDHSGKGIWTVLILCFLGRLRLQYGRFPHSTYHLKCYSYSDASSRLKGTYEYLFDVCVYLL